VLVDFGCSYKFERNDDQVYKTTGSPSYFAPEMVKSPTDGTPKIMLGKPIDIWAAGVTLYQIYTKQVPFKASSIFDLIGQITETEIDYSIIKDLGFVDLLKKMLEKNPKKRATVYDLFEDSWLTENNDSPIILYDIEHSD
jgi:calcium/calmodulin-dependent protein kinase kinase 2